MVDKRKYVPSRGDLLWVNFSPQIGHEQASKRPACVVSSKSYNKKSGLVLLCPITSSIKGYPFEVDIVSNKINGVILTDQVRSIDWTARKVTFIDSINKDIIYRVQSNIKALITE